MYFSRKSIAVFPVGVFGIGLFKVQPEAEVESIVAASRRESSARKPFQFLCGVLGRLIKTAPFPIVAICRSFLTSRI